MGKAKTSSSIQPGPFFNLVVFSVCMGVFPLGLFYASSKGYLDPLFSATIGVPSPDKRAIVAGVLAVVGVQLVIIAFICTAFKEEVPRSKKED